jgi:hypothetical protein
MADRVDGKQRMPLTLAWDGKLGHLTALVYVVVQGAAALAQRSIRRGAQCSWPALIRVLHIAPPHPLFIEPKQPRWS